MPNSKAIVTLALGAVYQFRWQQYCRANWESYAARHGYDVICFDAPLDTAPAARPATWQKCLILAQPETQKYDRVVWVDADIVFHPDAPCLASQVPPDRIGAVDEYATPTPDQYRLALARLYRAWDELGVPYVNNPTPRAFYNNFGLRPSFDQVVQGGLLVLSPRHHRELLESVYLAVYPAEHRDDGEMIALSHTLLRAGAVHWLDPRFDSLFACFVALRAPELLTRSGDPGLRALVGQALDEAFCLHLAGNGQYLAAARNHLNVLEAARAPASRGRSRQAPAVRPLEAPVAMFLFNRPQTTARVFNAIRLARPRRLLLVADGPRPDHAGDAELCAAARAAVGAVDWECEVDISFADGNLGLKRRVESGLDWVFQRVEAAIILEDDCLPGPDFFTFCDELLQRYVAEERVLSISGNAFQMNAQRGDSYYFSRYAFIWGWATWRRAWQGHDPAMNAWPALRDSGWLDDLLGDDAAASYWAYLFDKTRQQQDTWDYAWTLSCWQRNGLSAVPSLNLVSNIGYGLAASHTRQLDVFADQPVAPLEFPLRHPAIIERDDEADRMAEAVRFSGHLRRLLSTARARLRARPAS